MTDFETLCAMYDKAGIDYRVDRERQLNYYLDDGRFSTAIITEAKSNGVAGYGGFTSCHTFDADGNLLHVYNWE